mmetsp:Transcript_13459/g.19804  ORF Transcript_13459/g.19804 Transcript_13459/m.19804 type:complete len:211 (-) Transcript_13459:598-1230(-)
MVAISVQFTIVGFVFLTLNVVSAFVDGFGCRHHSKITTNVIKAKHREAVADDDDDGMYNLAASENTAKRMETVKVSSRRNFLAKATPSMFLLLLGTTSTAITALMPESAVAKSYSSNARNMERINGGDFSGGSVYDNNPSSKSARKRRAMVGCKIPSSREAAAETLGVKDLSEKECNIAVMDGDDPNFMLQAMTKLECPTCPYGVDPKPK